MNNRRALILLLTLIVAGCAVAPIQEMSDARQAIAAAVDAEAARLAPVPLTDAQRLISEAEAQIRSGLWGMARANAIRARDLAVNALNAIQADPQN